MCAAESDGIRSGCHQSDCRRGAQVWRQNQRLFYSQKRVWEVDCPPGPLRRKVCVYSSIILMWWSTTVHQQESEKYICLCVAVNERIEREVQEYEEKYRGRELPGFINYKTFEVMVQEQIKQLEEPAVKRLKDIAGI